MGANSSTLFPTSSLIHSVLTRASWIPSAHSELRPQAGPLHTCGQSTHHPWVLTPKGYHPVMAVVLFLIFFYFYYNCRFLRWKQNVSRNRYIFLPPHRCLWVKGSPALKFFPHLCLFAPQTCPLDAYLSSLELYVLILLHTTSCKEPQILFGSRWGRNKCVLCPHPVHQQKPSALLASISGIQWVLTCPLPAP